MVEDNDHEWTEEDLEFRKAFRNIPLHRIQEARARLERYVKLVYRIYESIREDPEKYVEFQKRLEEIRKEEEPLKTPASRHPSGLRVRTSISTL